MSDDHSTEDHPSPSWMDKLTSMFHQDPKDRNALLGMLRDAGSRGMLDDEALSIIEGAVQVADMQVREIMIPRSQMVCVDEDQNPEEFLPQVIESAHSRFPVIGDTKDEVIGILLAKDLLPLILNTGSKFNIKNHLRPATFIPESKRLNVLLREFRTNRNHMAIVIDEFGGVAGLVTIEDVLEQIVGDIEDETDVDEDTFIKPADDLEHAFIVKALTPIEDFNDQFATKFPDDEFDTIGGIVMQEFGHMPTRNESVEISGFRFDVLNADGRRIRLLRVTPC
ncbi:HlyC/CorC family transporter [Endozoicomonas sp.]|uniref:HlyC/CorC family transporter n=1 Tax=Endozoicomonas sp. TaxID=1892382 RepID=UPI003AF779A9